MNLLRDSARLNRLDIALQAFLKKPDLDVNMRGHVQQVGYAFDIVEKPVCHANAVMHEGGEFHEVDVQMADLWVVLSEDCTLQDCSGLAGLFCGLSILRP